MHENAARVQMRRMTAALSDFSGRLKARKPGVSLLPFLLLERMGLAIRLAKFNQETFFI